MWLAGYFCFPQCLIALSKGSISTPDGQFNSIGVDLVEGIDLMEGVDLEGLSGIDDKQMM